MKILEFKVADIDIKQLYKESVKSLKGMHSYADLEPLREHFYHIDKVQKRLDDTKRPLTKEVRDELPLLNASLYVKHISCFRCVKN